MSLPELVNLSVSPWSLKVIHLGVGAEGVPKRTFAVSSSQLRVLRPSDRGGTEFCRRGGLCTTTTSSIV